MRAVSIKGGRIKGTFSTLGDLSRPGPIYLARGFATAATVAEATGGPTVAAFNAGNLATVAKALRARHPERPLVVAADNDHHLPRRPMPLANVGVEKGAVAAEVVGGVMATPRFEVTEPGTDWNDQAKRHDLAAVREALHEAADAVRGQLAQRTEAPAVTPPAVAAKELAQTRQGPRMSR